MRALPRIHLITDPSAPGGVAESVARALSRPTRSSVAVHLRLPGASDAALARQAHELRRITADAGASLFVNRRVDVALACEADGVHLPERGVCVAEARTLAPRLFLGVSRHDAEGVLASSDADYVFLSPVHATPGKGAPLGARRFDEIASRAPVPVIALGGMSPERLRLLRHASGVAVIRGVLHADDPGREMTALDLALLETM